MDDSIEPGGSVEVPFTWIAEPGVHVVKVVANDILDNLVEIDMGNNEKTVAMTSEMVNFPDIEVKNIAWYPEDGTEISSEESFLYTAEVSNIGTAAAESFFVSLYIDGKWVGKQAVNKLDAGESRQVTFAVKPTSGAHTVTVRADDPVAVLPELNRDNNEESIVTPEFSVNYPELEIEPITWRPNETDLTDGTSLTFETKVKNTGKINITHKFYVDFEVDGQLIRRFAIDKLDAGEEKEVWARWVALPGEHTVKAVLDSEKTVTEGVYSKEVSADIPQINIIYPDLNISDVQWSPLDLKYDRPVTFIVRVSNQSVASVFDDFNVALYVDGKAVTANRVKGLRGHSTAIVDLTWKPDSVGEHTVEIVVDNKKEIRQEPEREGIRRSWKGL